MNTIHSLTHFERHNPLFFKPANAPELEESQQLLYANKIAKFEALFETIFDELERSGIVVLRKPLTGSQMADVALGIDVPRKDIDFLIQIEKPVNPYQVRSLVSFALRRHFPVEVTAPVYLNLIPFSIPTGDTHVDISIGWDIPCTCITSADSFQGDGYPILRGKGGLPTRLECADGYDPAYSLDLLKRGYFYVIPGKPTLMINGLRGYIHKITSGLVPVDYSIEKEFIAKWHQEFSTPELKSKFLKDLAKYISKHYGGDGLKVLAFWTNLRTVFETNGCDKAWLDVLDNQSNSNETLRLNIFWEFGSTRFDCAEGKYPPRFKVKLPSGTALMEVPWEATMSVLLYNPCPNFRELIISRLSSFSKSEHPIGKLLISLAKDSPDFIVEYSRILPSLTPVGIAAYEHLFKAFHPKNSFVFLPTRAAFILLAYATGRKSGAERAILELPNVPYSQVELALFHTIIPNWSKIAVNAPHLLAAYLPTVIPSEEALKKIAALPSFEPKVVLPVSWVAFVSKNPDLYETFVATPIFGKELIDQVSLGYVNYLSSLPPSKEVLLRLQSIPLKGVDINWADSWIEFVHSDMVIQKAFLATPVFKTEFKERVMQHLIHQLALEEPSVELLDKLSSYPACDFYIKWPKSWGVFIQENPHLYKKFIASPIFGVVFRAAIAATFLKNYKNIALFIENLIATFAVDPALASENARKFFDKAPAATLAPVAGSCWTLLQMCTVQTTRTVQISEAQKFEYLMIAIRKPEDFDSAAFSIMENSSLTVSSRCDLLLELLSFVRFFRTKFTMNGGKFVPLLLKLLENDVLLEKRKKLIDALSPATGLSKGLIHLGQVQSEPIELCLLPLAVDFEGEPEHLKAYIHYLLKRPDGSAALKYILSRARREDVSPKDVKDLMLRDKAILPKFVVEMGMESGADPEMVHQYLECLQSPLVELATFEKYTLAQDFRTGFKLAAQIYRLGGKDLFPELQKKMKKWEKISQAEYEGFLNAGMPSGVLLKHFKDTIDDYEISFHVTLGKRCVALDPELKSEIEAHFFELASKTESVDVLFELFQSGFLKTVEILNLAKPYLKKDFRIRKFALETLLNSRDFRLNLKMITQYAFNLRKPEELRAQVLATLSLMEDLSFAEFFSSLLIFTPILQLFITEEDWGRIYSMGKASFIKDPNEVNWIYLEQVIDQFGAMGSEDGITFCLELYDQYRKVNPQITDETFKYWQKLVVATANSLTTQAKQPKMAVLIAAHRMVNEERYAQQPVLQEAYQLVMTPIVTSTEYLAQFSKNVQENPANIGTLFSELNTHSWEIAELITLFTLLVEASKNEKVLIEEIAIAQFILSLEMLSVLHARRSTVAEIEPLIDLVSNKSLSIYERYSKELLESPPRIVDATKMTRYIEKGLVETGIQMKTEFPTLIALPNMVLRIGSSHATLLRSAFELGINVTQESTDLFTSFIRLDLFKTYDSENLIFIIKALMLTISNEPWPNPHFMSVHVTQLMQQYPTYKNLTGDQKLALITVLVHGMTTADGPKPVIYPRIAFEFLAQAMAIPDWELSFTMPHVQLSFMFIFRDLVEAGDVERAMQCLLFLRPMIEERYSFTSTLTLLMEKENALNENYLATPLRCIVKLRDEIFSKGLIKSTIQKAKKIPEQKDNAQKVELMLQKLEMQAAENTRKVAAVLASKHLTYVDTSQIVKSP